MRKHMKWVVVAIVAVLLLTVGLTAVVLAEGENGEGAGQTFIGRVADALGLGEDQVADAFDQARREMRDEAMEKRLQAAVEDGLITQDEADETLEWWQSRPEAFDAMGGGGRFRLGEGMHHRAMFGPGFGGFSGECPCCPDS